MVPSGSTAAFTLLVSIVAAAALLPACSCSDSGTSPDSCDTRRDCDVDEQCIDGTCRPTNFDAGADTGPCPPERMCAGECCGAGQVCGADFTCAMDCGGGRAACGPAGAASCCGDEEVCMDGTCAADCGARTPCDGVCCETGQMCHEDSCVAECDDPGNLCGEASELCCGDGEACLGDECVMLGDECERTEECPVDALCEPTLGRCVPRDSVEVCEFMPPVGEFSPTEACRWTPDPAGPFPSFGDVVMTPAVANLTDDNGDGKTDTLDVPDIVFVSFDRAADGCCTPKGVLRVVSGACNDDGTMTTIATLNPDAGGADPWIGNSTGVALGNLDPAGDTDEHPPEIVVTFKGGGTIAYKRTADDGSSWEVFWRNDSYIAAEHAPGPRTSTPGGAQPQIADLDGDGSPEVIIGNVVLDGQTGELVWDGLATVGGSAGRGNNAFLGPNSTVADIDLDGTPEVVAGNTVYDGETGAEEWTYAYPGSNSTCHTYSDRSLCDGFNGVADFDDDPEGEVVIVRLGDVYVLEHDGTLKQRVPIPWDDCTKDGTNPANESGPPTIADFDADGNPEIGTASADFYVVVDLDCTGDPLPAECDQEWILWKVPNQDCSSRVTGSSVFDFEGDGSAEVVYADETTFRIFAGSDGTILYEDTTHSSNTRMEMPLVVDVDNDGKSEVIVPEPNTNPSLGGIEVIEDEDNNWVRTRRIWNQHAYHVTNVTEDGQIPSDEDENWSMGRLNNFRQNVQPAGLFDAPDLVVESIDLEECAGSTAHIAVTVANEGALGVPPGIAVHAEATSDDGDTFDLGVQNTTTRLLPGTSETLIFEWEPPDGWTFDMYTVEATVDDDGTGSGEYNECDEDNNGLTSESLMACTIG